MFYYTVSQFMVYRSLHLWLLFSALDLFWIFQHKGTKTQRHEVFYRNYDINNKHLGWLFNFSSFISFVPSCLCAFVLRNSNNGEVIGRHWTVTKYTIVPHHHKELGKGLYYQILSDAGLSSINFINWRFPIIIVWPLI